VTNAQFGEFVAATGYVTLAEKKPDPAAYPDVDPADTDCRCDGFSSDLRPRETCGTGDLTELVELPAGSFVMGSTDVVQAWHTEHGNLTQASGPARARAIREWPPSWA
jgi:formylglycine-generating enzyme required for sulfatase activity